MADPNKNGSTVQAKEPEASPKKRKALTRDLFFSGGRPKILPFHMYEYDDADTEFWVKVRGMTAGEQDQVNNWQTQKLNVDDRTVETHSNADMIRAKVLSWCILDYDTEQPLFTPKDVLDIQDRSSVLISRLNGVVIQLSQTTAEEIEAIVKGFQATRENNSYSA